MKLSIGDEYIKIYDFNMFDALKIAIKLEKDGRDFYNELYDLVEDDKIKKGIKVLLDQEQRHEKYFVNKLDEEQMKKEDGFEQDAIVEYLDNCVFKNFEDLKQNPKMLNDSEKVLKLGVLIERTAINFYESILENTDNEEGKKAIQEIIDQEKQHEDFFVKLVSS